MKTFTAALAFLLLSAAAVFAQGPPDCQWTDTFSSATAGAWHSATSAGNSPCVAYRVTYDAVGMTGVSLQIEGAPWNSGGTGPGTGVALSGSAIVQGTNPLTSATNATLATTGTVYYPFVRINVTTFTPTGASGTITVRTYGYKGTSAAQGSSSGGSIPSTTDLLAGNGSGGAVDSTIPYTPQSVSTNLGIGLGASAGNSGSNDVIGIGDGAAAGNSGPEVVAIGNGEAAGNTGTDVVGIGEQGAISNSGNDVTAIGKQTAVANTGNNVLALGVGAANLNPYNNVIDLTNSAIDPVGQTWQPNQNNDAEIGDPSFALTNLYGNVRTNGGSFSVPQLSNPATPTVTPTCASACSSTWGYKIVAVLADGSTTTAASAEGATALQNATLSASDSNLITCTEVPGASFYEIFRTTVATSPSTTGIIGTLKYTFCSEGLVDNGIVGDATTPPTVNATGKFGPLSALGDMIYGLSGGSAGRVPGNVTAGIECLQQLGTGSASAQPYWDTCPSQSSLTYYFTGTTSSPISTYNQMTSTHPSSITTLTYTSVASNAVLQNFATNVNIPSLTTIPPGSWDCHVRSYKEGGSTTTLYCELWEVSSAEVDIGLIGTTEQSPPLTSNETGYDLHYIQNGTYTVASNTSRIVARVWENSVATPTIILTVGGESDAHLSLPTNNVSLTAAHALGTTFSNGNGLAAGLTAYSTVPYACSTLNSWAINVDTGTATVDVWRLPQGTANPTSANTITASATPAISTGTAIQSTNLTGWCGGTCSFAANDLIAYNLKAVAGGATQVYFTMECTQ